MRILKRGQIKIGCYRGTCNQCGCVVECSESEAKKKKKEKSVSWANVPCPTVGCGGTIHLRFTNEPYVDEDEAIHTATPWIPPMPRTPKHPPYWSLGIPLKNS